MKKAFLLLLAFISITANAQVAFSDFFEDKTLRLDYNFAGDSHHTDIFLAQTVVYDDWAGRRNNLDSLNLLGTTQIFLYDEATGRKIYATSSCSLFQEWQQTPEARHTCRTQKYVSLVPMPKRPAKVCISITNTYQKVMAKHEFLFDPSEILIRKGQKTNLAVKTLHTGRPALNGSNEERPALGQTAAESHAHAIDVAILSEAYTASEEAKFYKDAQRAVDAILSHEPYASEKDRFNFVAVFSPSRESGPSIPSENVWHETNCNSHFDTFHSARYITVPDVSVLYDQLAGVPFDQMIVLANTARYGGSGFFNYMNLAVTDHKTFKEVLVHEFSHGFAGLADEYDYAGEDDDAYYHAGVEPWEQNITTMTDFSQKWQDLLEVQSAECRVQSDKNGVQNGKGKGKSKQKLSKPSTITYPDYLDPQNPRKLGIYEGAGYMTRGCYRPSADCRMRSNNTDYFCPVCARAIVRVIDFNTK